MRPVEYNFREETGEYSWDSVSVSIQPATVYNVIESQQNVTVCHFGDRQIHLS